MSSSAVNICVFTLVLLSIQHTCLSRPHSKSKREIIKDSFNPLFPSDKFEKSGDGKYYLKKSAYKLDSEVKYVTTEGSNIKDSIIQNDLKADGGENVNSGTDAVQSGEPLKEVKTEKAILEETPLKSTSPYVQEIKAIKEFSPPEPKPAVKESAEKIEISNEKAPFTPVDHKFVIPPKPDSKDEILIKTDLPPPDVEEKVDEKVAIGQVPHFYPRLMPVLNNFRIPILIPIHKISYGAVSVLPVPPADISDRLPVPYGDDIVGEGGPESASDEEVAKPVILEKKDSGLQLRNALNMGVRLPLMSFHSFLKDLKDADKQESEKQSKIVDVLGKKFFMQSDVLKYPVGNNNRMFIRFMSVKPLEEVSPEVLKEVASDKAAESKTEETVYKDMKESGIKRDEFTKKEEIKSEESSEKTEDPKMQKEKEVMKVEETQINMKIEPIMPPEISLKNLPNPDLKKIIENAEAKTVQEEIGEITIKGLKDVAAVAEELIPTDKNEEKIIVLLEKGKSEAKILESKLVPYEKKTDDDKKTDGEEVKEVILTEESVEEDEKKVENANNLAKKTDGKKEVDVANSEKLFLVEKKKNVKTTEIQEEHEKLKKKSEKKKKKCKCEEKDSDSDEDDD